MKKPAILLLSLFVIFACSTDDQNPVKEEDPIAIAVGSDFRQVGYSYSDNQNGLRFVNATPGIETINNQPNGIKAQHWVYKSPSTQEQEIGFGVLYSEECENGPCDVILFLHGSLGSENSGSTHFYDYYRGNHFDKPRVLIFANGINQPDDGSNGHVWQSRVENGKTIDHPKQLVELIGGIVEDPALFPYMKRDMNHWSVTGFSAGASGVMGTYMDPMFVNNKKYQPKHMFPLGGWMTDTLHNYFDFDGGLALVKNCTEADLELIIANHIDDDVDCSGAKQYQSKDFLVGHFTEREVPFTYLGLTDEGAPCAQGADHNPVHSTKFYLNNSIENTIKNVNCGDTTYLEPYLELGDLLFRDY